ncbi:hypothetical protein JHK82_033201 [Glycine max]|nr:hypothetical protein JHK85_033922 [Glycine max]KAG4985599.1 hypothetical protein JHK86_033290 [Glycine max]KAG5118781.1 hypothetical protein JHK82_033201 [Glycine max]KAG5139773.1 hypothetical protein JHK84_033541 [Glycine max]KAH1220698.1 hypothetical protein GmHk_12G034273 [Glycine max]
MAKEDEKRKLLKVLDRRLFHEYGITLSRNSLRSTVSCLQRETNCIDTDIEQVCVTVCWIKQRCRVWELAVIKWTPPEMRILN